MPRNLGGRAHQIRWDYTDQRPRSGGEPPCAAPLRTMIHQMVTETSGKFHRISCPYRGRTSCRFFAAPRCFRMLPRSMAPKTPHSRQHTIPRAGSTALPPANPRSRRSAAQRPPLRRERRRSDPPRLPGSAQPSRTAEPTRAAPQPPRRREAASPSLRARRAGAGAAAARRGRQKPPCPRAPLPLTRRRPRALGTARGRGERHRNHRAGAAAKAAIPAPAGPAPEPPPPPGEGGRNPRGRAGRPARPCRLQAAELGHPQPLPRWAGAAAAAARLRRSTCRCPERSTAKPPSAPPAKNRPGRPAPPQTHTAARPRGARHFGGGSHVAADILGRRPAGEWAELHLE